MTNRGFLWVFIAIIAIILTGCAHRTKITKIETTTVNHDIDNGGYVYKTRTNDATTVTEKTVTTTTTSTDTGHEAKPESTTTTQETKPQRGILSSTVHAIGYVIALPFRIVAGIFRFIF